MNTSQKQMYDYNAISVVSTCQISWIQKLGNSECLMRIITSYLELNESTLYINYITVYFC